jgi:hypothetical protein
MPGEQAEGGAASNWYSEANQSISCHLLFMTQEDHPNPSTLSSCLTGKKPSCNAEYWAVLHSQKGGVTQCQCQSHGQPQPATVGGLPHSPSKHFIDLLLSLLYPSTLDRKGLIVLIC